MSTEEQIEKILKAKSPKEVLDPDKFNDEFKTLSFLIHPDRCRLPNATEAFQKLTNFRKILKDGYNFSDGICNININRKIITFKGDPVILKTSYDNYKKLMSFKDKASESFKKYLPLTAELNNDTLIFTTLHDCVCLNDGGPTDNLPVEHVRWVLSRLLEFNGWLGQVKYVHCGINPESFCIVPETHGIIFISFYHLTVLNSKIKTVSSKYMNWYEPNVFKTKIAESVIDTTMCLKSAIYFLGDKSGVGLKLKLNKSLDKDFLTFLITRHTNAVDAYFDYRDLVQKVFGKPKFHPLNL